MNRKSNSKLERMLLLMSEVGIYCRLSIEDRDKLKSDDSQSIQNQKAMLRDYCKEHDWNIYDIYCDDGYSGMDRNRPGLQRLLRDCESGKINIVLCKDQSRFSRDTIMIEQYINDKFLEWGIRFIGIADHADSDSEIYSTMRLFTSAYNEMYVRDISSKIRRTLTYKREQGQFIGAFAPYGYQTDPDDRHHLVIDQNTAPVVQEIFALYAQGAGYRKIVQQLNAQGIPSPSAYKENFLNSNYTNYNADSSNARGLWTQSTIAVILRNEMYTGTLVQGKSRHISYKNKKRKKISKNDWVRIPDAHEAIIDSDIWMRVQERLDSRTRVGHSSQEIPPLSGKVRCAVCGRPMKRNVYYNKAKTIRYYGLQCATYKTGAMNCTNCRTISGKILEQKIITELNCIVEQYCQSDDIALTDTYQEQLAILEKNLSDCLEKIKITENRMLGLYKDKLDGEISVEEYRKIRNKFDEELLAIRKQYAETAGKTELLKSRQQDHATNHNPEEFRFTELTRSIADEFIESVFIDSPDENGIREITIYWKI